MRFNAEYRTRCLGSSHRTSDIAHRTLILRFSAHALRDRY